MAQKITPLLLKILLYTLAFGQLFRYEIFNLPVYLHDILVILIVLLNAKYINLKKLFHTRTFLLLLFAVFISSLALLRYPISQLALPLMYLLRLTTYFLLSISLSAKNYKLNQIDIVVSLVIMIGIGYLQYFLLPDMRWGQYLGWDDHLSRLTLPHFDPTFSGLLIALAVLSLPHSSIRNTLISVSIPALLLTYSRSIIISLTLMIMTYLRSWRSAFIVIICISSLMLLLPKKFGEGNNLLRTYSVTARYSNDLLLLKKNSKYLLTGVGYNTLVIEKTEALYPAHSVGANNSYLHILLSFGVVGTAAVAVFLLRLYYHSNHRPMLLFFFITALFNNTLFYSFALIWVIIIENTKVPT